MEAFWKAAVLVILTIILGAAMGKVEKDFSIVLTVTACCLITMVAIRYLSEVMAYLRELSESAAYENPFLDTLMKISGIGLMTEFTQMLSSDTGNNSLGKAMQILGTSVMLFLSLPIFEAFFSVIQEIMRMI